MKIYDRKNKKYIESKQYGQGYLEFLYNNIVGRLILKLIINPFFSKIDGWYNDTKYSKRKIKKFIEKNNINMSIFEKKDYNSFNDFFTRKIDLEYRPISDDENALISPADSKLLVYKISDDLKLKIKGSTYTVNELVDNRVDLSSFKNGFCLVFRLSVDDYHRYCYIDDGKLIKQFHVKGKLHTVSSFSKDYKIYKENSRVVNFLTTKKFSDIVYIEVGALLVGKIINNYKEKFKRGEEKGFFKMGGSTIVVLIKDNIVKISDDIMRLSNEDIETIVKYREKIGTKL